MPGYYLRRGEKIVGPVAPDKLKELAASGKVIATDELSQKPEGPWTPCAKIKGLLPAPQPTAVAQAKPQAIKPVVERPASPVVAAEAEVVKPPSIAVRALSYLGGAISASAARRDELKMARATASASAGPSIQQNTVVKVSQRAGSGCLSGCLLLILAPICYWLWVGMASETDRRPSPAEAPKPYVSPVAPIAKAASAPPGPVPEKEPEPEIPSMKVTRGDVTIELKRAWIESHEFFGDKVPRELLNISLLLSNSNARRKIDVRTFVDYGGDSPTLKDDLGNAYKLTRTKGLEGQADNASIVSGKPVTDLLLFEVPLDAAAEFVLTLDTAHYGEKGILSIKFPAKIIEKP